MRDRDLIWPDVCVGGTFLSLPVEGAFDKSMAEEQRETFSQIEFGSSLGSEPTTKDYCQDVKRKIYQPIWKFSQDKTFVTAEINKKTECKSDAHEALLSGTRCDKGTVTTPLPPPATCHDKDRSSARETSDDYYDDEDGEEPQSCPARQIPKDAKDRPDYFKDHCERDCEFIDSNSDNNNNTKETASIHQRSDSTNGKSDVICSLQDAAHCTSQSGSADRICNSYKSYVKLKRQNACRQKSRTWTQSSPIRTQKQVRSRSLNHLDTLELRQGVTQQSPCGVGGNGSSSVGGGGGGGEISPAPASPEHSSCHSESTLFVRKEALDASTIGNIRHPDIAPSFASFSSTSPPPNRRHTLSRSQKSSSECFSVNFEVGTDESTFDTELFYPATRGITLREALSKQCEVRNIDLNSCDVWLLDRDTNCQSFLSLSQDTACLVGRHVRVTHKESRNGRSLPPAPSQGQGHSRKSSGSFRPRTYSSYFSSSTEEAIEGESGGKAAPGKHGKSQRWSSTIFGNSRDGKQAMEQLSLHLNNFSKTGLPSAAAASSHQPPSIYRSDSVEALNKLEDDWREIIINVDELSEKQQKQQTALWELIKTEVAYIKTLKVVTDLFMACLQILQDKEILKEIDTTKLFSNIREIHEANVQFWRDALFPLIQEMRETRRCPSLEPMCDGFARIKDCFQSYYRFCGEQGRCQHYCRENLTHNELFAGYLAWCESQKECNRLRLLDILVQPMQRLTKYGLLLKAILKNTDNAEDRDSLNIMIRSVDDFVNNVNYSLKQKQDNERLNGIMARIESYDIVDTKEDELEKLVNRYRSLDLNKPMVNCCPERRRHLLLEGDLKLKDTHTSKMEVHCFLLTDMLLICKVSTKKGGQSMRVIRQPYLVDRLVVQEINKETPTLACIYKNEFDLAVSAFLLQNNDAKKLKSWMEGIKKAQELYRQAKHNYLTEESLDTEFSYENVEGEYHYSVTQLIPRSPLATSSRASRVSSLAHSHSGSVEMNDQSSLGSTKGVENENRTASISSDEGASHEKSPSSTGSTGHATTNNKSFKHRVFTSKTPNTLSVHPPYGSNLGQSLPNLALGASSSGYTLSSSLLSVPSASAANKNGHLLSPTNRGISYPPPSPSRANLTRGMAISQNKNPPLIKTRHVTSTSASMSTNEFDVHHVITGAEGQHPESAFLRGQQRQVYFTRCRRTDNKRYHTAGAVDDIKRVQNDAASASTATSASSSAGIQKRMTWNCGSKDDDKNA